MCLLTTCEFFCLPSAAFGSLWIFLLYSDYGLPSSSSSQWLPTLSPHPEPYPFCLSWGNKHLFYKQYPAWDLQSELHFVKTGMIATALVDSHQWSLAWFPEKSLSYWETWDLCSPCSRPPKHVLFYTRCFFFFFALCIFQRFSSKVGILAQEILVTVSWKI